MPAPRDALMGARPEVGSDGRIGVWCRTCGKQGRVGMGVWRAWLERDRRCLSCARRAKLHGAERTQVASMEAHRARLGRRG